MLATNITLKNVAAEDQAYVVIGYPANGSERITTTTTAADKASFIVKHTESGKGASMAERHLLQISREVNTIDGSAIAIVNLTISNPVSTLLDNDDVKDLVSQLVDFLVSGTVTLDSTVLDAVLRGES